MPLSLQTKMGDANVSVWSITETEEELVNLVPYDCSHALASMSGERRRKEWLAVRALLAEVCGSDERICYDEWGKPFLASGSGFITVSHTDGYALIAYSEEVEVGADIELISRDVTRVARKFVPEIEIEDYKCNSMLLLRWCVCEALFKLVGDVEGTYKDNIRMKPLRPRSSGSMTVVLYDSADDIGGCKYTANYMKAGDLLICCVQ